MRKYDHVVTITGAAGFVGSNLARSFLEDDANVRVWATDLADSDRLKDLHDHPDFTFEVYDAHQPIHSDMLAVDTFYHFAGIANPERYLKEPLTVIDLNLDGLRNVLERISRWRAHTPRIVYSSTSEVYGRNQAVPYDEQTSELVYGPTQKRRWCYALTKAVGEHILQSYSEQFDIRYTIFRFFNLVGDDVDAPGAGRVITRMVGSAFDVGKILVTEPGTQTRCFCYTPDFVKALKAPTYLKKADMEFRNEDHILNLGSDEEVTMLQLAYKVKQILKEEHHIVPQIEVVSPEQLYGKKGYDDIPRRVPKLDAIEEALGWKAELTLDDFLPAIVRAAASKHLQRLQGTRV